LWSCERAAVLACCICQICCSCNSITQGGRL
jgi:hypothetical protein